MLIEARRLAWQMCVYGGGQNHSMLNEEAKSTSLEVDRGWSYQFSSRNIPHFKQIQPFR